MALSDKTFVIEQNKMINPMLAVNASRNFCLAGRFDMKSIKIATNADALALWRNLENYCSVAVNFSRTAKLQKLNRITNDGLRYSSADLTPMQCWQPFSLFMEFALKKFLFLLMDSKCLSFEQTCFYYLILISHNNLKLFPYCQE